MIYGPVLTAVRVMSAHLRQLSDRLLVVLGLALVVCTAIVFIAHDGQSGAAAAQPAPGASKSTDRVSIKDFLFKPEAIDVAVGTKITFTNEDAAPHTATSEDGGVFDTGTLTKGESGSVTIENAGTFAYLCTIHPFMKGTVTAK